jgi:hypothetical protein
MEVLSGGHATLKCSAAILKALKTCKDVNFKTLPISTIFKAIAYAFKKSSAFEA